MRCYDKFDFIEETSDEFEAIQGLVGPYFTPSVDQDGNISWTNNGGLPNPETVNIKGQNGEDIHVGGIVETVEELPETADDNVAWLVGTEAPYEAYIYVEDGWVDAGQFLAGEEGDPGATFIPAVSEQGIISWTNDGGLPNPEPRNIKGPKGDDGNGVPSGGTTGQVLKKRSGTDYDAEWADESGGGGGTSDYTQLSNKPQINGTTLTGNQTGSQLGLVDAVSGKGLSTNDYTTAEKDKLSGIEAQANKTTIDSTLSNTGEAADAKATGDEIGVLRNTLNQLETETETVENGLAIIINGNSCSSGASQGKYVYLKDSTITGCADGLYTAAQAIPASTAIDGTYLTPVSGGGLNSLNDNITQLNGKIIQYAHNEATNVSSLTVNVASFAGSYPRVWVYEAGQYNSSNIGMAIGTYRYAGNSSPQNGAAVLHGQTGLTATMSSDGVLTVTNTGAPSYSRLVAFNI